MSDEKSSLRMKKRPFRLDACGACTGGCGDSIEVCLELQQRCIGRIAFQCDGCVHTFLAAQGTAALAHRASLDEALKITAMDVLDHLGELGEDHEHCALIAVNALHEAAVNALRHRREPG